MKKTFLLVAFCVVCSAFAREVSDFCDGWEFSRDNVSWRSVEVPHDWAIEGPFDPEGDPNTAKLPWKGVGYYRKPFVLNALPAGKRIFLDFDGIMCDGTVYINGQSCANQPYGYLGVRADITPYVFAGTNSILVKADTTKLFSRWYPGAGMYRRVRKIVTSDVYLNDADVYVLPSLDEKDGSGKAWKVNITGSVVSRKGATASPVISVVLKSPEGAVVAEAKAASAPLDGYSTASYAISLDVRNPRLWEMRPNAALYTAEISLASPDGSFEDLISVRTGFRTFRFDLKEGFVLNGRRVQLNGACIHSDLGILGMAFNRSAMRRELKALMDMGVNAIRSAHNPHSPEMLDLCDELGLFVWDECFDKWNATSGRGDVPLEDYVPARLREFVRRDRNHPCIFVWSIGNEISPGEACPPGQEHWASSPALGTSAERCAIFRNVVLSLDKSRPVGMASCFFEAAPKGDYAPLDITGWNYGAMYRHMRKFDPSKPVLYTEAAASLSDYGHYSANLPKTKTDYDVENLSVDSYDRNSSPWSDIPDREFERVARDRYVSGMFIWTGVTYLGECMPFNLQFKTEKGRLARKDTPHSSSYAPYDLLVLPKDRMMLYRSYWNKKDFTLHIVPSHWNFSKPSLPVYVYTSAPEAELFLNGVSLGRRKKSPTAVKGVGYYGVLPRYRLIWEDVKYAPGELKAIAYGDDGKIAGEAFVRTAGEAENIVLKAESETLPDDPREYVFVEVSLSDAKSVRVPSDNRRVFFKVEGPGKIVSVGSSNMKGTDSFKDVSSHCLYNGRAGLFIRRTGKGAVRLVATSGKLKEGEVRFK